MFHGMRGQVNRSKTSARPSPRAPGAGRSASSAPRRERLRSRFAERVRPLPGIRNCGDTPGQRRSKEVTGTGSFPCYIWARSIRRPQPCGQLSWLNTRRRKMFEIGGTYRFETVDPMMGDYRSFDGMVLREKAHLIEVRMHDGEVKILNTAASTFIAARRSQ